MLQTPWGDADTLRDRRLPPGRSGDRDAARRDQRERLFAALVASCDEKGYDATSVEDLLRTSGVSRATFETATRDLEPDYSLPDLAIPGRQVLHVDRHCVVDDPPDGLRQEQAQRVETGARFDRQAHGELRIVADLFAARAGCRAAALAGRRWHVRMIQLFLFC